MNEGITYQKSKKFAVRIVKLYQFLCDEKHEYVLSKQLLRSGTGVGANIAEANCAFSEKDFLAKMFIAFKECAETEYWLELLFESSILNEQEYLSIDADCKEMKRLCHQLQ